MPFAAFLIGIAGSLVKRVLAALGFGIITYVGFQVMKDQLEQLIIQKLNGTSESLYQILAMSGIIDALGIWLGAITSVIILMQLKKLGSLLGG